MTKTGVICLTRTQPLIRVKLMVVSLPQEGSATRGSRIPPDIGGKQVIGEVGKGERVAGRRGEAGASRASKMARIIFRGGELDRP